jgi:hypothetical protein
MSRESFMDKMRKAGKSMVDVGAKTMLKVSLLKNDLWLSIIISAH